MVWGHFTKLFSPLPSLGLQGSGGTCFSLPSFPLCLPQYFPGQPLVQNFLHSMNNWLKRQQRKKIPYGFFKATLDNRKEVSVGTTEVLLCVLNNVGVEGVNPVPLTSFHNLHWGKESGIPGGSFHS